MSSASHFAQDGTYLVGLGCAWVKFLAVFGASPQVLHAPIAYLIRVLTRIRVCKGKQMEGRFRGDRHEKDCH